MRALKLALSVAGIALMMGISTPPSQAQDVFTLQLCNKYKSPVRVALVFKAQNSFVAKGWFGINANSCADGKLPLGPFAIFAYAGTPQNVEKAWGGDIKICVNPTGNFENVLTQNSRCKQGEVVVGFQGFDQPTEPQVALAIE